MNDIRQFSIKDIINLRNPRVVAIGGGTGMSSILRGIKEYTDNITAIVTVGDDGGSSGRLREDMGLLPPGDIRNCILALAEHENLMTDLFDYRFKEGELKGHSFGNLFLAAMNGISYDFYQAIRRTSDVLHIKGQVLPVTLDPMILCAELENGQIVEGESLIPIETQKQDSKIKSLFLLNEDQIAPLEDALKALEEANIILLGPGSLYTSVISNLLVPKISESIRNSSALVVWVSNLVTQTGETSQLSQTDHLNELENYLGSTETIDVVIQNNGIIPEDIKELYEQAGQEFIEPLSQSDGNNKILITDNLVLVDNGKLRHNDQKVAELLFDFYINRKNN